MGCLSLLYYFGLLSVTSLVGMRTATWSHSVDCPDGMYCPARHHVYMSPGMKRTARKTRMLRMNSVGMISNNLLMT